MSRVSAEDSVRSPISMIHKETKKGRAEGGLAVDAAALAIQTLV
jgi:hypothetical protein